MRLFPGDVERGGLKRIRKIFDMLKTNPASCIKQYQNSSSRNRFNDFQPQNASRSEPVKVRISQRFRGDLTQFLHSFQLHLLVYEPVFVDVRRRLAGTRVGWVDPITVCTAVS